MSELISQNNDGVIYVANDQGETFGIASATKITDADGLAFEQDALTVLENNGFELMQDWDSGATYIEFRYENGETARVVFSADDVAIVGDDDPITIDIKIDPGTLGDSNTDDDNQRYVAAVQDAIETDYPGATVSVSLSRECCFAAANVSYADGHPLGPADSIRERVAEIQGQVWDQADY